MKEKTIDNLRVISLMLYLFSILVLISGIVVPIDTVAAVYLLGTPIIIATIINIIVICKGS